MRSFGASRGPSVGTVLTGAQVSVSIVGHADFDAQGREFEIAVSQERRAQGARAALVDLLGEEAARVAILHARLQAITFQVTGVGKHSRRMPHRRATKRTVSGIDAWNWCHRSARRRRR